MTKWARMRKRKERKRAGEALSRSEVEGTEVKLADPEKISFFLSYSDFQK